LEHIDNDQENNKIPEIETFPVPFSSQEGITIKTNTPSEASEEQIINQAIQFHIKGNISEATKYYQRVINQGCNDHRVFSNYGGILQNLGKLQQAELSTRKAIELKPDFAEAHSNLGTSQLIKTSESSNRKA
tara:strand:- start:12 stop:407 length:396 start_codon:yes stop_codon:yes gene_type:complete